MSHKAVLNTRGQLPSLAKEGWMRPLRKRREATLAGADGVVCSSHRLSEVERTTPAAPTKEPSVHFCWWRGHPSFAKEGSLPPVFRALLMGNDQLKTCNMDRLLQV